MDVRTRCSIPLHRMSVLPGDLHETRLPLQSRGRPERIRHADDRRRCQPRRRSVHAGLERASGRHRGGAAHQRVRHHEDEGRCRHAQDGTRPRPERARRAPSLCWAGYHTDGSHKPLTASSGNDYPSELKAHPDKGGPNFL